MRTWTDCGDTKEVDQFLPIKACKQGWYGRCRECRNRRARERYWSSPAVLEVDCAVQMIEQSDTTTEQCSLSSTR